MYAFKKSLAFLLAMVLCVGVLAIPAYAAQTSQNGLEVTLTTDKDEYDQDETITATLTVANTGDAPVVNVSLQSLIPEGYVLGDGQENAMQMEKLSAGETVTLTVLFVAEQIEDSTTGESTPPETNTPIDNGGDSNGDSNADNNGDSGTNSDTNSTDSGVGDGGSDSDGGKSYWWIWVLLIALVVIVLTVLVVKTKLWKRFMALALCMVMLATVFVGQVNAAESAPQTIYVTATVQVADKQVELKGKVIYQLEEVQRPTKPENPSPADEYFWANSEVLDVIEVAQSDDVLTETEVKSLLQGMGFTNYPITYTNSMDGTKVSETEVADGSTAKHPTYQTFYVTENKEVWAIYVMAGSVIANPLSFNLESDLGVQLLISETEALTSYDDKANKFYVTIPFETAMIVKTVNKIDAATLEKLTKEEISKL